MLVIPSLLASDFAPARLLPPLARWRRVRRERLQLLELSDRMLADIGVTRTEAGREAARPFWDLPPRP